MRVCARIRVQALLIIRPSSLISAHSLSVEIYVHVPNNA